MATIQESKTVTLEQIQDFKGKYPKQLWYLFLSEMWERFAFYGMRGMLTIFMVEHLFENGKLMTEKNANLKYGAIQAFIYTMAFVGGLFADKILGFRKSIFWGGILMIIGSFTLAFSPEHLYYIGISFTIVGTGFFKPNISTMVGTLYKADDPRRDAGFGLFYSGINIGALLGGYLCIYTANHYSWNAAFSLAGIGMVLGLGIFIFTKRTLGPIGLSPLINKVSAGRNLLYDILFYAGSLLVIPFILLLVSNTDYTDMFMYIVGPLAFLYIIYETVQYKSIDSQKRYAILNAVLLPVLTVITIVICLPAANFTFCMNKIGLGNVAWLATYKHIDIITYSLLGVTIFYASWCVFKYFNSVQQKIVAALVFIIFSIFFWAFFEQAGGSLSLFARYNLNHKVLGITIDPNEINNSANSAFVILFSPLFGLLWLWMSKKKIEPNTLIKFGLGFLFVSLSFYVFYYTRFFDDGKGFTSLNVFTLAYLVVTIGELCLSPIGLSLMTKLAPQRLHGMMMGMWFLASAYGQYAAGILGAGMTNPNEHATLSEKLISYTEGYKQLAIYALIAGVVLIVISPVIRKWMHDVH